MIKRPTWGVAVNIFAIVHAQRSASLSDVLNVIVAEISDVAKIFSRGSEILGFLWKSRSGVQEYS